MEKRYNTGMANKNSQAIAELVLNNPGEFTYQDIGERFNLTSEQVRGIARNNSSIFKLFKKKTEADNGIIEEDNSSLKGVVAMKPDEKQLAAFEVHCRANNLPLNLWRAFWHKTKEYSSYFINEEAIEEDNNRHSEMLADLRKLAPRYKKRKIDPVGEHLLFIPNADIHVGKWAGAEETGAEYNMKIAVDRVRVATDALVSKAMIFGVKQFVVCLGNDVLHTDNGKTTTNGTPQDNDGTFFRNFRMAKAMYIGMIEQLALHGDVLLVHVPSNHDWRSGYTLSEAVSERFHFHPNVKTMITERHRKYIVYGQNLIMVTHGDGVKEKDLHWHLATEGSKPWSKTKFRYIYLGHLHHKIRKIDGHQKLRLEKDLIGFTEIASKFHSEPEDNVEIEYVRSPSGADGWHDRNGYTSKPAMEVFLHHPQDGQVARFTHFF